MKKALLKKKTSQTLDLDFIANKFSHEVLFSRNSAATMIGPSGLEWAPCNLIDRSESSSRYIGNVNNGLNWFLSNTGVDSQGYGWFEYTVSGTLTTSPYSEPRWVLGSSGTTAITPNAEYSAALDIEIIQTNNKPGNLCIRMSEYDAATVFLRNNYGNKLTLSSVSKETSKLTMFVQSACTKVAVSMQMVDGVIGEYYEFTIRIGRLSLYPGRFTDKYYPTYNSQYFGPRDEYKYSHTPMNLVANSTMQGATNSSLPTRWTSSSVGSIQVQVVGTGIEDGFEYLDVRWSGTNTHGSVIYPSVQMITIPDSLFAKSGMVFSSSIEVKLISGTGVPIQLSVRGLSTTNTYVEGGGPDNAITPTSTYSLFTKTSTFSNSNTVKCNMILQKITQINESYDFTVRIRKPQLNRGSSLCQYIKTQNGQVILPDVFSPIGRLIEDQKTNLLKRHHDADYLVGITPMEGSISVGVTVNNFKLIKFEGGDNANPKFVYGRQPTYVNLDTVYTISSVVSRENRDIIQIAASSNYATVNTYANFDLVTGTWLFAGSDVIEKQALQISENTWRLGITFRTKSDAVIGAGCIICPLDSNVTTRLPSSSAYSSVHIGYQQFEQSEGMSSIIPTYEFETTRAAETCYVPGGNWLNKKSGTLVSEIYSDCLPSNDLVRYFVCLNDGTNTNRVFVRMAKISGLFDAAVVTNDVFQGLGQQNIDVNNVSNGKYIKHAIAYGDKLCHAKDGNVSQITTASVPNLTRLDIGNQPGGGSQINGHVLRIKYLQSRVDPSTLVALTK